MQSQEIPQVRTNEWGVDLNYQDAQGEWHEASGTTVDELIRAMRPDPEGKWQPDSTVIVMRQGESKKLPGDGVVTLESGGTLRAHGSLPSDLPLGYHTLLINGHSKPSRLIVGPSHCWLPDRLRTWGWAVQLYAARSRESWGMGDLADLEKLAVWSASLGAGMLLVNPLSAAIPLARQETSPYYPSSRRFLNPLWLHIEWVPGADDTPELAGLAATARSLNEVRVINRDRVYELKMKALNAIWLRFSGDKAFSQFSDAHGQDLEIYATFCALAEKKRLWLAQLGRFAS